MRVSDAGSYPELWIAAAGQSGNNEVECGGLGVGFQKLSG